MKYRSLTHIYFTKSIFWVIPRTGRKYERTNIRTDERKDENYISLGINAGGIIKFNVYSCSSWADNPKMTKFWCQQKPLVNSIICYKFKKKTLWSLILYTFFHDFIHVYSPRAGADSPYILCISSWSGRSFVITNKVLFCSVLFYTGGIISRRRLILSYTKQQVIPNIYTKFQNPRFSSS